MVTVADLPELLAASNANNAASVATRRGFLEFGFFETVIYSSSLLSIQDLTVDVQTRNRLAISSTEEFTTDTP